MVSRKSQIHSQIFIYILSIILVAIIFFYGYKAIDYFINRADEVSDVKFRTDLESAIRIISPDYGSVKRMEFILPNRYSEICFVDSDVDSSAEIPEAHIMVRDMVDSGVKENAFFMTDKIEDSVYVGNIEVEDDYICIKALQGRLRLELKGLGDRAEIKSWNMTI